MTLNKLVVLSLTALFVSAPLAVTAQAATTHKPVHRVAAHPMRHGMSGQHQSRGTSAADRSADSLNAQSLSRSQGAQQ